MSGLADDTVSLEQFAVLARLKPRFVRELKLRGRLVLTEEGDKVLVRASNARIRATEDTNGELPAESTLSDFALLAGFRQSYASQLKAEGRLVLTEDGKRVRVAESLAKIRDTRDPSKTGVVDRHAVARGSDVRLPPDDLEDDDDLEHERERDTPPGAAPSGHRSAFHEARAKRETHMAELAAMDVAVRRGELLDREAVRTACAEAVTTFRTRLEGLSTTLGPQLAPVTDEGRCTALLAEHFEHLLEELERKFRAMTPEAAANG
jgi:hypothetical protein